MRAEEAPGRLIVGLGRPTSQRDVTQRILTHMSYCLALVVLVAACEPHHSHCCKASQPTSWLAASSCLDRAGGGRRTELGSRQRRVPHKRTRSLPLQIEGSLGGEPAQLLLPPPPPLTSQKYPMICAQQVRAACHFRLGAAGSPRKWPAMAAVAAHERADAMHERARPRAPPTIKGARRRSATRIR
jgi:hypothetical protein